MTRLSLLSTDMRQKSFIALFIFLFSSFLYSGCEKYQCNCYCSDFNAEELTLNDTVDLKYSELYCNSEHEIRVSFDSLSDSRCPIGAMCFWEGNASVKFMIEREGESKDTFTLNTHSRFITDTVLNGVRYELIDLLPYPEIGKDYVLDDYILQVLISD